MGKLSQEQLARMAAGRDAARARKAAGAATGGFYNPNPVSAETPGGASRLAAEAAPSPLAAAAGSPLSADVTTEIDNAATLASEIARIRKIRKPLGAYSQKLALPERPGYHRHWFNDTPGRIEEAEANGWSFVQGNDGKPVNRVVGTGRDSSALRAYAMELPQVLWQEDVDARHAEAKARIDSIKSSPFRSKPGESKPSDQGKFYSPQEDVAPVSVEVR